MWTENVGSGLSKRKAIGFKIAANVLMDTNATTLHDQCKEESSFLLDRDYVFKKPDTRKRFPVEEIKQKWRARHIDRQANLKVLQNRRMSLASWIQGKLKNSLSQLQSSQSQSQALS